MVRGEGLIDVYVDEGGAYPKEPQIRAKDTTHPALGRLGLGLNGVGASLYVDSVVAEAR